MNVNATHDLIYIKFKYNQQLYKHKACYSPKI